MLKPTLHNIIGYQAWHVFLDGEGKEVKEECTVAEYDALALADSVNPTKDGHTWIKSYKDWKYDTTSGRLEPGTYIEWNDDILVHPNDLISPKGTGQEYLPKEMINDETIWR